MSSSIDVDGAIKLYTDVLDQSSLTLLNCSQAWKKSEEVLSDFPYPEMEKDSEEMDYAMARSSTALVDDYMEVLKCLDANEKANNDLKTISNTATKRKYDGEALPDLNAILDVYKQPLQDIPLPSRVPCTSNNPRMKEAIRGYQNFCTKLFKSSNPEADIPEEKLIRVQLSFLREASENSEEFNDMEIEETLIPVCPLSSRPFEDPVISLDCKHHYSKKNIEAALGRGDKITCPSRGCSQYVYRMNLVRDPFMDFQTRIWVIEQKRKRDTETQVMETL